MTTHSIEKETKTIGLNIRTEMSSELEKRAASMHLSVSNYCKIVFQQWLESGEQLTLSE